MMMQTILLDQAKIRRRLGFVNKIEGNTARRRTTENYLDGFGETIYMALKKLSEWFSKTI
jgi:hypothetical protein